MSGLFSCVTSNGFLSFGATMSRLSVCFVANGFYHLAPQCLSLFFNSVELLFKNFQHSCDFMSCKGLFSPSTFLLCEINGVIEIDSSIGSVPKSVPFWGTQQQLATKVFAALCDRGN